MEYLPQHLDYQSDCSSCLDLSECRNGPFRCVSCHSDYLTCLPSCLNRDYPSRLTTYLYCKFIAELLVADDENLAGNWTKRKKALTDYTIGENSSGGKFFEFLS